MKKIVEIALGITTSIGGFLDVGAIATAAAAGATFQFQLMWALALGTICVIFLVEMAGRLSAASGHTLMDAVRERFGLKFYIVPFMAEVIVDFLVLGAEIGGVCLAMQLVTGISFRIWAIPVALVAWIVLWRGTFELVERGISLLGLVTLAFVVAAIKIAPEPAAVAQGLIPSAPTHDHAGYWFTAVAILGALISPYLFYFYSSGAVQDKWDKSYIGVNRIVAILGMGFGSLVSIGVLVVAGAVLYPRGIHVDNYEQAAMMMNPVFGSWGFILFAASLGIACFGASLEVALDTAYISAQFFGWNGRMEKRAAQGGARFNLIFTFMIFASSLLMVAGIDPLKLTMFTMALTAVILPIVIGPFLVLMNDAKYVGKFKNSWVSNVAVVLIIGLTFVLAVVAIPLEIMGG